MWNAWCECTVGGRLWQVPHLYMPWPPSHSATYLFKNRPKVQSYQELANPQTRPPGEPVYDRFLIATIIKLAYWWSTGPHRARWLPKSNLIEIRSWQENSYLPPLTNQLSTDLHLYACSDLMKHFKAYSRCLRICNLEELPTLKVKKEATLKTNVEW